MQGISSRSASELYVADTGRAPDEEAFELRLPCGSLHQGLCATQDRARYSRVLAVSESVEMWFSKRAVQGTVYVLRHLGQAKSTALWVSYAAHIRRRLHEQHVVVLARVQSSTPGRPIVLEPGIRRRFGMASFVFYDAVGKSK